MTRWLLWYGEGKSRRPGDLAARYGGEEFAVILPNTDSEGAYHLTEAIRQGVAEMKIPHAASTVKDSVTASFGVSTTIPCEDRSPETLISRADEALYSAKKEGRNRIVSSLLPKH